MLKYILLSFLAIFTYDCAGSQQRNTVEPPNVFTADVPSIALIDEDAYNVRISVSEDVSIHLPLIDGVGPTGELIAPLRAGQPAPYNGVIFNGPAVARVVTEFQAQATQCVIDRQADVDRLRAIAIRDINLLNTSLVSQRRVYELMIQSRDIELRRFYNLTLQANNNNSINPWPIVLSGLGGLVLGGGIMSGILLLNGH